VGYIPQMAVCGRVAGQRRQRTTTARKQAVQRQRLGASLCGSGRMPEEKFAELPRISDDRKGTIRSQKVTPNKSYSKNVPSTPRKVTGSVGRSETKTI
jgi:hypothetical protein